MFQAINASGIFKAIKDHPMNMTESVKECPIQIASSNLTRFMDTAAQSITNVV